MAFLALASQKSVLNMQRNFLQLRNLHISNQRQICKEEMDAIKLAAPETCEQDQEYLMLEAQDEEFESEKDAIEQEMSMIDAEINSLKTLVNNNIKSSCTLNISGGS